DLGEPTREAGVVEQHVRDLVGGDELRGRAVHGGPVAHIHLRESRGGAVRALKLGSELRQALAPARPEDEGGAGGGEAPRAGGADPRARARDEDELAPHPVHATIVEPTGRVDKGDPRLRRGQVSAWCRYGPANTAPVGATRTGRAARDPPRSGA